MGRSTPASLFHKGPLFPLEVWVILVIALLLRLSFYFHQLAIGPVLQHDGALYLALAEGSGNGAFSMFHPLDIPETTRMPGYPALIHVLGGVETVLFIQVLLSSVKIPLAFLFARAIGIREERVILMLLLLLAVQPVDILITGSLLTESLFTTIIFAATYLVVRSKGYGDIVLAAGLFAAAAYLRPNGLHLALLAALFLIFRGRHHWRSAVAFVGVVLVLLLPWAMRNQGSDGRLHLSDSGPVVAAHFHVPAVLALAGDPAAATYREQLTDLAASTDWTDRAAMRSYFEEVEAKVWRTFVEHPLAWLAVQLKKAARISIAPGRGYINTYFSGSPLIAHGLLMHSAFFSLVVVGVALALLARLRMLRWPQALLLGMVFLLIFSSAISTPDARFRDPAMPLILLLGAWVVEQWKWGRRSGEVPINPGSAPV